jgi:hypothetical protein
MSSSEKFPVPSRPLEYVAFFHFEVRTKEGPGYIYLALDAFRDYAFSLGVEREVTDEMVLRKIYFLMEDPEFEAYADQGFTIVLEEHQNLVDSIQAIIGPLNGKVLFNKAFNNHMANPVLAHFAQTMRGRKP